MAVWGLTANSGLASPAGNWKRAEAYNLTYTASASDTFSSARTQAVTFANAGNQYGLFINLRAVATATLTVKLQEYTGGSWVNRTTDAFDLSASNDSSEMLLFLRLSSYAVTTAGSTWRYQLSCSSTTVAWIKHNTNGYVYAVLLDASSAGPSSGDTILVANERSVTPSSDTARTLTIDATFTFNVTDALTTYGVYLGNDATIAWQNPAAASYTLTLSTMLWHDSSDCLFQVGASGSEIEASKQAVINWANAVGHMWYQGGDSSKCGFRIEMYGDYSAAICATASQVAAASQARIYVSEDMTANWSVGDNVCIVGKVRHANDTVVYTLATVAATYIELSANLDYIVPVGARIVNRSEVDQFGVQLVNAGFTSLNSSESVISHFIANGVFSQNVTFGNDTGYLTFAKGVPSIQNCLFYQTVNGTSASHSVIRLYQRQGTPSGRTTITNVHHFSVGSCYNAIYSAVPNTEISNVSVKNHSSDAGGLFITAANCTLANSVTANATSNYFPRAPLYLSAASAVTISNCLIVGGSAGVTFAGGCAEISLTNCQIYAQFRMVVVYGLVVGVRFVGCDMGETYTYSTAFSHQAAYYYYGQFMFENCKLHTVLTHTALESATPGSYMQFHTFDQIANDHRGYYVCGNINSCGDGLTDTTVHTAGTGKFAIRFESSSSTNRLEWSFKTPTGNIATKTMTVAVWCKINAAAYYSGTHQKPRLTIDYDNGTEAYAEAVAGTDWQLLSVTFVPTTSYGQIVVTLSTMTDATGSDAYVYFDDMAVIYPAGYKLDLGGMDLWADALPITPPLATVLSAGDVWNLPASGLTGTGTIGQVLNALVTGQYHFDKTGGIETIKDSSGNTVATFTVTDTATEVTKT